LTYISQWREDKTSKVLSTSTFVGLLARDRDYDTTTRDPGLKGTEGGGNGFIKQCKVMTTRTHGVVRKGVAEGWVLEGEVEWSGELDGRLETTIA
jgi:hypothetical protein